MIIAAISTALGAEPGMPSARQGMMWPGIDAMSPVSAAIRPSIEPLPKRCFSLLTAFAAAYDIQAPESSPTPGRRPVTTPITPERMTVRQYWSTSRKRGSTESFDLDQLLLHRIGQGGQHLGQAEGADQCRDQGDAAGELAPVEGEAVVGVEALLADLGDEEAERAHQPALDRIVADDRAATSRRRTGRARRTRRRRRRARPRPATA